jgi:hypothetical protein
MVNMSKGFIISLNWVCFNNSCTMGFHPLFPLLTGIARYNNLDVISQGIPNHGIGDARIAAG